MSAKTTALAACLSAAIAATALGAPRATGLPDRSPARTVGCNSAAGGVGVTPPDASRVGPFRMLGRDDRGSHWSPATRRFTSKVPVVIVGPRPVTVRVPDRLAGRLAISYGGPGDRGLAGEITFVPCAGRAATFFPGGMLFSRREPLSLLVRPQGWKRPALLRLGVFPPY